MNVDMVLKVTDDLIHFLEEENQLLKKMRVKEAAAKADQKDLLLGRYRHLIEQGENFTPWYNTLTQLDKDALKGRTKKLLEVAGENEVLLARVATANQRFIDKLTKYMQKEANRVSTYSPLGRTQSQAYRSIPAVGMSIAMNQQM